MTGYDTFNADASAIPDIADLWSLMWANMGGQPEDEPDRRTVAEWFAAGECPPERLADANEQLGALLGGRLSTQYYREGCGPPSTRPSSFPSQSWR